ncbi:MAG: hypothetical protein WD872_13045 [Pirellulaceae bacterium]
MPHASETRRARLGVHFLTRRYQVNVIGHESKPAHPGHDFATRGRRRVNGEKFEQKATKKTKARFADPTPLLLLSSLFPSLTSVQNPLGFTHGELHFLLLRSNGLS